MLTAFTSEVRYSVSERRLIVAFALSLAVHLTLYGTWQIAPSVFRGAQSLLMPLLSAITPKLTRPRPAEPVQTRTAPEPQRREIPMSFLEVDPAIAAAETPRNAQYYSTHNVPAVQVKPATQEATQPKLEGTQTKVPRLLDTPRPVLDPKPMQPVPEPKAAEVAKTESKPIPASPPRERADESLSRPKNIVGDLAMNRPSDKPFEPAQPEARVRPRTLAEARQMNPALPGQAMAQDGGVKRYGRIASPDVAASPFGEYDRDFIQAVERRWNQLLDQQRYMADRRGKVVVDFRLTSNGRITEMVVNYANVGEVLTLLCERAILDPAPFRPWPGDMRRMIGSDHRDVRFTFFYD